MDIMGACFDRAEYLIQEAEQVPLPEPKKPTPSTKWKSFSKKRREQYSKSIVKQSSGNLRETSKLLKDLVEDFDGSRLLVNLFPADDGYSVTLMKNDGTCAENLHMPYEETELLDYIDNEQLPPTLVDTLHRSHNNAFIHGSVVAEIRDYRIAADEVSYETNFVLLRPTQQTLQNDVNLIVEETSGTYKWGADDKLSLESMLTLATAEPLCLDPSPVVAIVKNKMQSQKGMLKTSLMQKMLRKNGLLAHKRAQALKTRPAPSSLKLHDFLTERKKQKKDHATSLSPDVKLPVHVVDVWRKMPLTLSAPSDIDTAQHVNAFTLPQQENISNEDIIEVQSILLESESGNRDVCSRITIGQRPRDMQYFGMLQSNKYFKQNVLDIKDTNQIFSLGTEHRANLYILQYQELFTEDGRRPAKVTVRHANKGAMIYHIPNQQQPWQLSQEKSVYAVGSVIGIPPNKWKKMNLPTQLELKLKLQHQQQATAALLKQKAQQKQQHQQQAATNSSQLSSTTPTLNAITLQNSSQNAFNFSGNIAVSQRLTKKNSNPGSEIMPTPIQPARQGRLSADNLQALQARTQSTIGQSSIPEGSKVLVSKNSSDSNSQTITMNSSVLATALGQIGGTVTVPVMAVTTQRATSNPPQEGQSQGQPTAAVIRMPVGIASGGGTSSGQLTGVNLLSGGQNVLGNIQLATSGGGITIPVSQLPANLAMQLTSIASANPQQISLIAASSGSSTNTPQRLSLVGQSGNTTTPFAVVASTNNDVWQIQDSSNATTSQQTYTIAPRMQIAPSTSRPNQTPQSQVQVVRQLQIPAHLLTTIARPGSATERVQQLITAQATKNAQKRRATPE